jgi:hypothetical protein
VHHHTWLFTHAFNPDKWYHHTPVVQAILDSSSSLTSH